MTASLPTVPDLSIIVPTLNFTKNTNRNQNINRSLKECLTSLVETTPKSIPIVVASNNGDSKFLPTASNHRIKRINVWEQGQCKAVNAAVATTNSEWIMVTNDDMVYPKNWLDKLSFAFWCFSPTLVEPIDGAPTFIKHPCGGAGGDFDKDCFKKFEQRYQDKLKGGDIEKRLQKGFNLPFIIKRELWDLVGGYDINYDPWGSNSDSDLEYKIKLAGVQPMQLRTCLVYHFSQTSGTQHPENKKHWNDNWNYFKEKWGFERVGSPQIWKADFEIPYEKLKFRPNWAKIPKNGSNNRGETP